MSAAMAIGRVPLRLSRQGESRFALRKDGRRERVRSPTEDLFGLGHRRTSSRAVAGDIVGLRDSRTFKHRRHPGGLPPTPRPALSSRSFGHRADLSFRQTTAPSPARTAKKVQPPARFRERSSARTQSNFPSPSEDTDDRHRFCDARGAMQIADPASRPCAARGFEAARLAAEHVARSRSRTASTASPSRQLWVEVPEISSGAVYWEKPRQAARPSDQHGSPPRRRDVRGEAPTRGLDSVRERLRHPHFTATA